jgi:glycosyltransferase involved in cell wall biosynthesis
MWGAEALAHQHHRDLGRLAVRLSSPDAELRRQEGREARRDLDRLDARCLELADVVAAISEQNLRDIVHDLGVDLAGTAVLTPLGIPVDGPPLAPAERPPSREVLYVGRLEPRKGIQDLIAALPRILAADPSITVTVAGDSTWVPPDGGTYFQQFERTVPAADHSRVTFCGRLSDQQLEDAYRRAALAVFPSRYESFGLVVLEALVHGTPVVATRVGGIPEVLDESAGRLVPPGSPEALAEAVTTLMADDALRDRLGRAGAAIVRERFSVDRMLDTTLLAYRRALATHA